MSRQLCKTEGLEIICITFFFLSVFGSFSFFFLTRKNTEGLQPRNPPPLALDPRLP